MPNNYYYLFSPAAKKDIETIYNYISDVLYNHLAADDLIDEIKTSLDLICIFPSCGPLISNPLVKSTNLRKYLVKNYIIFYQVIGNEIRVIRVIYGMRNYYSML